MRVYLDTETSGLDVRDHEVIEVAWASDISPIFRLVLPHTLKYADPEALRLNGYYERKIYEEPEATAEQIRDLHHDLRGSTLTAANPGFDRNFLSKLFLAYGMTPEPWHHRSLDVQSMATVMLGDALPSSMANLVRIFNDQWDADLPMNDHTAAGDVDTLRQMVHFILDWRTRVARDY